jgi:phospholipid-binding lipoprotein MlaA
MNVLALRWQAPLLALLSLSISGCTTTASRASDSRDPLEPINRVAHQFNEDLDRALLRPVARGYHRVVPEPLQIGVSNVFFNAKYPVTMVNNALQGKFVPALSDLGRITLNTTLGLGGLFDPATSAGLERYDEDFGQTLGAWGVPSGIYVVVPLLGPYTLRDGIGSIVDDFAEPRSYLEDDSTRYGLWAGDKFDRRVRLLDADAVLDRTGDSYAFIRSAYLQRREFLVNDGIASSDDLEAELEKELKEDSPKDP